MNASSQTPEHPTLVDQRPVIGALAAMAGMFGSLPAGHFSVYRDYPGTLGLSLDAAADLEAWRDALGLPPASIKLHPHNGAVWLSMSGAFMGVQVSVHMHQVPVSFDTASVSPAEDARLYREGRLAEQLHQLGDAAEPDESAYIGLPAAWSAAAVAV